MPNRKKNIFFAGGAIVMNFWRDFNIKALFCGPFFYFWQGMVRRGAFLLTLACLCWLGAVLQWQSGNSATAAIMLSLPFLFCALQANADYAAYLTQNNNYNPDAPTQYYSVSLFRLIFCSIVSGGFYDIYWSYRQWNAVKHDQHAKISPFLRCLSNLFFIYPLFNRIYRSAAQLRYLPRFPSGLAAMSYILINLAQEPKNYDSLSSGEAVILAGILAASALSLIPAQKAINFNNARLNGALKFAPVRWHEVVITLIGLLLMISYFWANQFLYN